MRDDAVKFIRGAGRDLERPFFLYLPFQECRDDFDVISGRTCAVSHPDRATPWDALFVPFLSGFIVSARAAC